MRRDEPPGVRGDCGLTRTNRGFAEVLSNQFLAPAEGATEVSATKVSHSSVGGPVVVEKKPPTPRRSMAGRRAYSQPSLKGITT
jgi:hypothetical protein